MKEGTNSGQSWLLYLGGSSVCRSGVKLNHQPFLLVLALLPQSISRPAESELFPKVWSPATRTSGGAASGICSQSGLFVECDLGDCELTVVPESERVICVCVCFLQLYS